MKNIQMHKVDLWRELLGHIIEDPQERQRIAQELGISPITLSRWVKSDSMKPRPHNLQRRKHFSTFRQRVQETMIQAQRLKHPMNIAQAEQVVWQEIEAELLHLQQ